jgi:formylglycine-generating enzyme required for sulfatase activity
MGSSPEFIHARRYTRIEDHLEHEQPQHRVRISRPLLLASQEVTVQQFRKFADATGYVTTVERNKRGGRHIEDRRQGFVQKPEFTWRNPGYPQADSHPVVHVTWEDAHAYCDWLSKAEHAKYRLPTEAEWEYACAGDSEFQHPFALRWHSFAMCVNCADASIRRSMGARYDVPIPWDDGYAFTAPVGTYWTNRFGLSEMLGNVWELCEDNWTERYDGPQSADAVTTDPLKRGATASVCRGSSFFCNTEDARACRREMLEAHEARSDVGFRIVREVSP